MSLVTDPEKVDSTIGPDGQQKSYLILSDAERAKGFIRPVRFSYKHVGGPGPKNPLRDLTPEEIERYSKFNYVKYEEYPDGPGNDSSVVGRYWTQSQLDAVGRGCGAVTTMGSALAETYAAKPTFYGATFCSSCRTHFPVGADGEFVWDPDGSRVGT